MSSRAVVCIVEDPAVREGFLVELRKILDQKLIAYEIVDKQRSMDCEWSATYTARWSWDLALYMSFAQITVYHNGKLDGEAIYDATKGGGRMDKFIDAETKIRELVDSLIQQTGG